MFASLSAKQKRDFEQARRPPPRTPLAQDAKPRRPGPIRASAAIEVAYRRRLQALVSAMAEAISARVLRAYRANTPELAQDALPDTEAAKAAQVLGGLPKLTDPQVKMLRDVASGANLSMSGAKRTRAILLERGLVQRKATPIGGGLIEHHLTDLGMLYLETLDTPAETMAALMSDLGARWQKQFDKAAPKLADYFATAVSERSATALKTILREGGWTVKFTMTPAMADVFEATVAQNVQLIKSIPQQYLLDVQGAVMRSVQAGRDLGSLAKHLEAAYGVSKRRAALIARDQNNKATSALTAARQISVGISKGVWRHSAAGKEPRPKHVKADGTVFDLRKGLPIGDKPGSWVMPGEEINCRCFWVPVIEGFGT